MVKDTTSNHRQGPRAENSPRRREVSENGFGMQPPAKTFPHRNPLINSGQLATTRMIQPQTSLVNSRTRALEHLHANQALLVDNPRQAHDSTQTARHLRASKVEISEANTKPSRPDCCRLFYDATNAIIPHPTSVNEHDRRTFSLRPNTTHHTDLNSFGPIFELTLRLAMAWTIGSILCRHL